MMGDDARAIKYAHTVLSQWYQGAILASAQAVCEDSLRIEPHRSDLLHARGLLAIRERQHDIALECLTRAAELEPTNVTYSADLGEALVRQSRHADAEETYRQALSLAPEDCRLHRGLARALTLQGRIDEGLLAFRQAAMIDPSCARTYADWGEALQSVSEITQAIDCYERAVQLDPQRAEWHSRLGRAFVQAREWQRGLDSFRTGLRFDAEATDLHIGCGTALLGLGRIEEAAQGFQAALAIDVGNTEALRGLLVAFELLGRPVEAAGVWFNVGRALERRLQLEDAAAAYREALARKPEHLKATIALGSVLLELNEPGRAVECFERALANRPDHLGAHHALSRAAALNGDLERHWNETAWCNCSGFWKRRYFEQPAWDGRPLDGRTILLWTNETVADTILLIRFAQHAKRLGGRVVVEVQAELVPLVTRMNCVDHVVPQETPLPSFDVQAILPSIPQILRTDVHTIPNAVPYLEADHRLAADWRVRLDLSSRRTIGLTWAGQNAAFASIVPRADQQFVILENTVSLGLGSSEAAAALMVNFDQIITADTKIAHLAGALGCSVWTILSLLPDCRWFSAGETSPWYPTMRVFRQRRRGDWTDVAREIGAALEALS